MSRTAHIYHKNCCHNLAKEKLFEKLRVFWLITAPNKVQMFQLYFTMISFIVQLSLVAYKNFRFFLLLLRTCSVVKRVPHSELGKLKYQ